MSDNPAFSFCHYAICLSFCFSGSLVLGFPSRGLLLLPVLIRRAKLFFRCFPRFFQISWDEVNYLTHRLCMFGSSSFRLFLAFGSGRFFAHGLRLSLMSKKVSTFALRHKMAATLRIPKQDRHSLNGELEPHRPHGNCERLGSNAPRRVSISHLASRPWVNAVPLSSGVNPDEILPRETRKSSHCGRVAFSFQSW